MSSYAPTVKKTYLVCLIAGLLLMLIGFSWGGAGQGFYVDRRGVHLVTPNYDKMIKDAEMNLPSFTSIRIAGAVGDISFVDAEKYGIEVQYSDNGAKVQWQVIGGVLQVESNRSSGSGSLRIMSFDFSAFDTQQERYITIYLPKSNSLDFVEITDLSMGTIDISGITARAMELSNSFGAIKLGDLNLKELSVSLSKGDLLAKRITSDTIRISNNFGEVSLEEMRSDKLSANLSKGDFKMNRSAVSALELSSSFGDLVLDDLSAARLTATLSKGDFRGSQIQSERLDIKSSFGAVTLDLASAREDYNLKLATSMGSIYVDGVKQDNRSILNDRNGTAEISVNAATGDIRLRFGE